VNKESGLRDLIRTTFYFLGGVLTEIKSSHLYRRNFTSISMNTSTSPVPNSIAVKEVSDAVEQLRKAMISADGAVLRQLASDELSYGHSNGSVQNKQQFISSFTSVESVFINIEISGQTVQIINDTAIVRHTLSAETDDKGKGPGSIKISILLVWVKNDQQGWKLVARQAVRV
jgi:ketosteroid isomerase-like protein